MLELVLVFIGSLLVIGITLALIFLWGSTPPVPPGPLPPIPPAPTPPPPAPTRTVFAVPPPPRFQLPPSPTPVVEATPSPPPVQSPNLRVLTISRVDATCQSDSECGTGFVCARSRLESNQVPYENELFERFGASIEDALSLDGKLYFLLDKQRVAIVTARNETTLFETNYRLVQLVGFNHEVYLRSEQGELYVFREQELVRVRLEEPVRYLNATPDGHYLYLNHKLYNPEFQVVLEFPTHSPRVFLSPTTHISLGKNPVLTQQNQPVPAELPPRLVDAAFNTKGELFLLEAKEERFRKIVVVGSEPFLLTRRYCQRS